MGGNEKKKLKKQYQIYSWIGIFSFHTFCFFCFISPIYFDSSNLIIFLILVLGSIFLLVFMAFWAGKTRVILLTLKDIKEEEEEILINKSSVLKREIQAIQFEIKLKKGELEYLKRGKKGGVALLFLAMISSFSISYQILKRFKFSTFLNCLFSYSLTVGVFIGLKFFLLNYKRIKKLRQEIRRLEHELTRLLDITKCKTNVRFFNSDWEINF